MDVKTCSGCLNNSFCKHNDFKLCMQCDKIVQYGGVTFCGHQFFCPAKEAQHDRG